MHVGTYATLNIMANINFYVRVIKEKFGILFCYKTFLGLFIMFLNFIVNYVFNEILFRILFV